MSRRDNLAYKVDQQPAPQPVVVPYIASSEYLPEMTIKAFVLGILLAVILAGSNAYLGLKMGQTISASIPAAVISMTVLRLFRRSNILENNIVQTIASAGEVIASGIVFTMPALLVLGYWTTFDYWQITLIAIIGGVLGVLYSIPLRRALIVEGNLRFPEGVATAEVLKAGAGKEAAGKSSGVGLLVFGALGAGLMKFSQTGLHLLGEAFSGWFRLGGGVFGLRGGLSLAMLGAGYIVGLRVAINLLVGTLLGWLVIVPYFAMTEGPQAFNLPADVPAEQLAMAIRAARLRYIGVGTMIVGGLWAILTLVKPIRSAVASSFHALKMARAGFAQKPSRTDYDIPMTWVTAGVALMAVPLVILFNHILASANLPINGALYAITLVFLTLAALVIGFICASIGGYMAGIVGSSATPLSGITIGAILIVSLSLVVILGEVITFGTASRELASLAAVVIIIAGIVASSASLSCDNLQDLKSGQLVGATPWKQQLTLIVGVVAGSIVVAPILQLLYEAYGIADIFPRIGMDPTKALAAPQANLMASVVEGIFQHKLDWWLVQIGIAIGVAVILVDRFILAPMGSEYRLSALAVALGIYLPMDVTLPLITGGVISFFAQRSMKKQIKNESKADREQILGNAERRGLLFSAGMIAGDAMLGIVLAIPFALHQSTDVLAIVGESFGQTANILGVLGFGAFGYYLYTLGTTKILSRE